MLIGWACLSLSWFPTSKGFWKEIAETHRSRVWPRHSCFILTWKKIDMQQSVVFWWKSKRIFPSKNVRIDSQPEKCLNGDSWCRINHKVTELHADKLRINFFILLLVASLVSQVRLGVKKQRKFCWYVKFSEWKGEFWIQEVTRARSETCLLLSSK